jgi:hypothetical protein
MLRLRGSPEVTSSMVVISMHPAETDSLRRADSYVRSEGQAATVAQAEVEELCGRSPA